MPPVSSSLSSYSRPLSTQISQLPEDIYSPPKQNLIEIPELRIKIEKYLIEAKKAVVNYWRAWAMPIKEYDDIRDVLALTFSLVREPRLLKERKEELEKQLSNLEIEKEKQVDEQKIEIIKKDQQACAKEIAKIERERQARYREILNDAPELRAFMLEQPAPPALFDTENAERFAHRYEQVAPYLQTLEEYSKALQGFKKFLAFDTYTSDSSPTLDKAKKIQNELLGKWFKRFSISPELSSTDQWEAELLSVKGFFLADLRESTQRREQQTINERLGRDLRGLAEEPVEKVGTILEELTLSLRSSMNAKKMYFGYLAYDALVQYLPIIPEAEIKPILEILARVYENSFPDLLKSIFFEKLKLYSENEAYELIEKIMPRSSFSDNKIILKNYPKLPRNLMLEILKIELERLADRQSMKLLNYLYNYAEIAPENELRLNIKDIIKLIQSVSDLDLVKFYDKDGEVMIDKGSQNKVVDLLKKYLQILPVGETHSLLIGITNTWNLFNKEKKNRLVQLMKVYLPIASNKEEVLFSIIRSLGKLNGEKERSLIIQLITPYLNGKYPKHISLPALKLLTENWGDWFLNEQEKIIAWLNTYLSKNRSPELREAIQRNLGSLPQQLQNKARLLGQLNSEQTLEGALAKLRIS